MDALDALTEKVDEIAADSSKAVDLIGSLRQQIADLQSKVAAGIDPAALAADVSALGDTAASLEGALPAPAAPAPAEPALTEPTAPAEPPTVADVPAPMPTADLAAPAEPAPPVDAPADPVPTDPTAWA